MADDNPVKTPSQIEDDDRRQRGPIPPYDPSVHRGQRRRRRDDDDDSQPSSPPPPPPSRDVITQGWVMYGVDSVLLPWQMLPFHTGWKFYADTYRIRYKRLQVVVDEEGEPVAEDRGNRGYASWADPLTTVSITYADGTYGFSGWRTRTERLTMQETRRYQGLARVSDDPDFSLWKPSDLTSCEPRDLRPRFYRTTMPGFVPESLSECPGLLRLYCLQTGWRYVVPVDDCHLVVSGEPGMNAGLLEELHFRLGQIFTSDDIFIGGSPVIPKPAMPTNEDRSDDDRSLIQRQAKFAGFSEEALLNPNHDMRVFQWNLTPMLLPYSRSKGSPPGGPGKKGRKGSGNDQAPEGAKKIHEHVNRPNLDVLARVLPGLTQGSRGAFGY